LYQVNSDKKSKAGSEIQFYRKYIQTPELLEINYAEITP
jgi:hypothetical protein